MGESRFVSYSGDEKEIVRQGIGAIRSVLAGNDESAKLRLLLCLDWFMDPYYGQDISDIKDELITILQEIIISDDSFSVKEDALNLLTSYEWPPFPILEKSLDTIDEKLLPDVKYAINMDKEISRALNEANKLLSEMSDHHLRGSYKVVSEEQIEWQIQDDVRIEILLHGSDAGLHDVLVIFFNDPDGKEHRCYYGDDYPHDSIIELLLDYNAMEFNVKKGLFGWRLKTK
jgi:hypothetical protein